LSICLLSSKVFFNVTNLFSNIICLFTRSSHFATLSLNYSWIPCTISSDFLTISRSLFPCSKSFIIATINSSFFFSAANSERPSASLFPKAASLRIYADFCCYLTQFLAYPTHLTILFFLFILSPLGSLVINYPILLISIGPYIPTLSRIPNNSSCLHIE